MKAFFRVFVIIVSLSFLFVQCEKENGEINLNEPHFTIIDTAFFNALILYGIDTNKDGKISNVEAEDVEDIGWICMAGIVDLTGIEHFVNLKGLHCHDNELTWINLRKNTALEYIDLENNQLTHLNVRNCSSLKRLDCRENQLRELDVSNNNELRYLYCSGNGIDLDVSNNPDLQILECNNCRLRSFDISNNISLIEFACGGNKLTHLDIRNNKSLQQLEINDMNTLTQVCVWESFPSSLWTLNSSGSPNIQYTTDCSQ